MYTKAKLIVLLSVIASNVFAQDFEYKDPNVYVEDQTDEYEQDKARQPLSVEELAKQNAFDKTSRSDNREPQYEALLLQTEDPVLVKVLIPESGDPIASIFYRGGITPYKLGNVIPPNYKITNIEPTSITLACTSSKRSECKLNRLNMSGVYLK